MNFVPVKSKDGEKLMPTTPTRAGMMIKCGDATPYWDNGIFCIRLNREASGCYKQEIVVGVDPGSKKEGFTVKSKSHTYLNVQADAHNQVGKKIKKGVSCGAVEGPGSVRTAKTAPTASRIKSGFPQARVQGGIGS